MKVTNTKGGNDARCFQQCHGSPKRNIRGVVCEVKQQMCVFEMCKISTSNFPARTGDFYERKTMAATGTG